MISSNTPLEGRAAMIFRIVVGAVIGIAIALMETSNSLVGEGGSLIYRNAAATGLFFMAFVLWAGASVMRPRSLAIWAGLVGITLALISWSNQKVFGGNSFDLDNGFALAFPLVFIAHELVSTSNQARRFIAPYETYFDQAWKRGVQLALALLFTGLFFGILALGGALLNFIGFTWLNDLLSDAYFRWPMAGMAFGAAVHLADAQPKMLNNVRNLALGVLSWLLPVISIIGTIFAISLLFSGLAPLWETKAATTTLLSACIAFVLLINATYQLGDGERDIPFVLKWCVRVSAVLLLVFALLAAWSLLLRIFQYGLTPDRIFAGLGVVVALCFGIGYGVAALPSGRWMARIEPVNVGMALVKCVLFFVIMTPLASPAMLSVRDQVGRLNAGKVSVDDFDWWLLAFNTGTYGKTALEELVKSTNPLINAKAKLALAGKLGNRTSNAKNGLRIATRADRAAIPVVFPKNAKLPDSFLDADLINTDRDRPMPPECLRYVGPVERIDACKIALLDVNDDNKPEILVRSGTSLQLTVMFEGNGEWWPVGDFSLPNDGAAFDRGELATTPSRWRDLQVGGGRVEIDLYGDFYPDSAVIKEPATSTTSPPKTAPPPSK